MLNYCTLPIVPHGVSTMRQTSYLVHDGHAYYFDQQGYPMIAPLDEDGTVSWLDEWSFYWEDHTEEEGEYHAHLFNQLLNISKLSHEKLTCSY